MVVWKLAGKVELFLVGKNFSFEMRLDILVMIKSIVVNEGLTEVLYLYIAVQVVGLVSFDCQSTYNPF